ncbi:MAG TPA: class I poly(R)-hydroxyalkanoic acid synthase [Burkholderiaceae bacterium]|nr:class I poly(R)-hydroxyalkanoic acid synthase [Burkholderiaceae bacterium]
MRPRPTSKPPGGRRREDDPQKAGAPGVDTAAGAPPPPGISSSDPPPSSHPFAAFEALWRPLGSLRVPVQTLADLQAQYLREAAEIWNKAVVHAGEGLELPDRRFSGEAWLQNPAAAYTAAMYLLNARTLMQMADSVEADEKMRARIRFAVQQWIDASAPSNFLALNPDAQRKALETQGQSIAQGVQHLLDDIRRGHLSQTDESVFEVGRNVATTEGQVIFENELFQLIEYAPRTAKVYERPLLIVPPCINKYYILDLQPDNSFVRYAVEQGVRVFLVSWRNADQSMAHLTWDDYIEEGVMRSVRIVQEVSGQPRINTLGFCIGGTLLGTALAVLAGRGEQPAASLTLLTSFLDFSNTGVLDIFVDEASVRLREMTIGEHSPAGGGVMQGRDLAATFSFLRPNDLVWNYVVGNYLKGETPPPFDLLYWNSDSTNLPGPMYCWYLRNTYLENNLATPGKVRVCGVPVDLGRIEVPSFIYGSREDHIVPWEGAYASTRLLGGDKRFVLGASGHIAGVINPPAKKKRSHWTHERLPADAKQWLAGAREHPGSWWPLWSEWLVQHAGRQVTAPRTPGNRTYKPIEPAPGRYVKQKA